MKKFLAVAITSLSILGTISPAYSGLGDAETESVKTFDAWCGKRGNDCKVEFTEDRLIVNGNDGINRDQFTGYSSRVEDKYDFWTVGGRKYTYYVVVNYREGGVRKSGTFLFANRQAWEQMISTLNQFSNTPMREVGPSIAIDDGKDQPITTETNKTSSFDACKKGILSEFKAKPSDNQLKKIEVACDCYAKETIENKMNQPEAMEVCVERANSEASKSEKGDSEQNGEKPIP